MAVPQNVRHGTTLWSNNDIVRYLPNEYKNSHSKGYIHPDVYSKIIYNSLTMETAQVSSVHQLMNGQRKSDILGCLGGLSWLSI